MVAPVDQRLPKDDDEFSVTESPWQNVVGPFVPSVGVDGTLLEITIVVLGDVLEQPKLLIPVTE